MKKICNPISYDKYAVIYCHESNQDYVKIPTLEIQEKLCREYCGDEGWKIDKVFVDKAVEKFGNHDSQLIEALSYCSNNSSKVVMFVVWGRVPCEWEVGQYFACKMLLAKYDIRFESASCDDDHELDLMDDIICAMKEYEYKVTALHMYTALVKTRESGELLDPAPYGYYYSKNPDGADVPFVDPDEGHFVTEAFWLFSMGIYTKKEVVDHINWLGIFSRRTLKQMTIHRLTNILKNRIYVGDVFVNDEVGYVPSAYEPLVSRDVFDSVQEILSNREQLLAGIVEKEKYLLNLLYDQPKEQSTINGAVISTT